MNTAEIFTNRSAESALNLDTQWIWESGDYWKVTKDKNGKVTKVENDGSNDVTVVDENGNQIGATAKYDGTGKTAFLAQQIGNGMSAAQANQMLINAGYSYNGGTGVFDPNATANQAFDLSGNQMYPTVNSEGMGQPKMSGALFTSADINADEASSGTRMQSGQGPTDYTNLQRGAYQYEYGVADPPTASNSRIRDGDATGVLPLEGPCVLQAYFGNVETVVGRNLNSDQTMTSVKQLTAGNQPAMLSNYWVNRPMAVIEEGLVMLGEDPKNYTIIVGNQGDPPMPGVTGSILSVSTQIDKTKPGHSEEGDAKGSFVWDPISGNSQDGRVVFPKLTRWVSIVKKR